MTTNSRLPRAGLVIPTSGVSASTKRESNSEVANALLDCPSRPCHVTPVKFSEVEKITSENFTKDRKMLGSDTFFNQAHAPPSFSHLLICGAWGAAGPAKVLHRGVGTSHGGVTK